MSLLGVCNQTGALLNALVQLCHISTPLAEKTWVQLFPRLWKILSDRQQHVSTSVLQRAELTVGHFPLNIFHVEWLRMTAARFNLTFVVV